MPTRCRFQAPHRPAGGTWRNVPTALSAPGAAIGPDVVLRDDGRPRWSGFWETRVEVFGPSRPDAIRWRGLERAGRHPSGAPLH